MAAWRPILWYNRGTHGMTETRFHELENTESMEHWWISLSTGKPVIIPDTSVYRETNPEVLLPHFSCHSLRHTFTTRMCEAGVNIKVIQDALGHSDISTTLNIYADVTNVVI